MPRSPPVQLLLPLFCLLLLATPLTADGRRGPRNAVGKSDEDCRPKKPEDLWVNAKNEGEVIVTWKQQEGDDGCIDGHLVVTCAGETCDNSSHDCGPERKFLQPALHADVGNLTPLKRYSIRVAEYKEEGPNTVKSDFGEVCITAPPKPPVAVSDLELECVTNPYTIKVTWKPPTGQDSEWNSFHLRLDTVGSIYERRTQVVDMRSHCKDDKCSFSFETAKGGREYAVYVVPHMEGIPPYSVSTGYSCCRFNETAPPKPTKDITFVDSTPLMLKKTQKAFLLPLDAFSDINGELISYTVLVAQDSEMGSCKNPVEWAEASTSEPVKCYPAITVLLDNVNGEVTVFEAKGCERKDNSLQCILGHEETCKDVGICNGQLKVGVKYGVIIRASTRGGSTNSEPVYFTAGSEDEKVPGGESGHTTESQQGTESTDVPESEGTAGTEHKTDSGGITERSDAPGSRDTTRSRHGTGGGHGSGSGQATGSVPMIGGMLVFIIAAIW